MHGVLVYSSSFCRRKSRAPPQLLDTIFNLIPTYWAPHLVSSSPRLVAAILFWIVTMSFQVDKLEANASFDNAKSTPTWVVGNGQQIRWRCCFIRIYTTTNRQYAVGSYETCDGQGIVPQGTELFLGGEGGHVTELERN
ncbi:hypothetical protein F5B18DRAFT_637472 [Nemania serpens]|nr:hypothetical protein F5B18DRAFT_637472 [Nemania serpens]